jgi:hypothetical protein
VTSNVWASGWLPRRARSRPRNCSGFAVATAHLVAVHKSESGTFKTSTDVRSTTAFGGNPDIEQTSPNERVWTHLRHQRAIFAVMHSGVLPQRRGNVRP